MSSKVLFSAVTGTVLSGGQPVESAVVERSYRWVVTGKHGSDRFTTGPDGRFHFDKVISGSLLSSIMPHEPIVEQKITVSHDGKTFEAWTYSKRDYKDDGEAKRPLRMRCDLQNPAKMTRIDDFRRYFGICELE